MPTDEGIVLPEQDNRNEDRLKPDSYNNAAPNGEEVSQFYDEQVLSAEEQDDEVTNNDGSVKETLDTAFHDIPGYITNHSLAGSNRADYYEKRLQGKSDTEEEQDYVKNHPEA